MIKGKQVNLVQHCIYEIATGKWPPGMKLPSVRQAENLWGMNKLTVMAAYQDLEKMGLVVSRKRSGFYVKESSGQSDQNELRELINLFPKIKKLIHQKSSINLPYAFSYFNRMALDELIDKPRFGFVECTMNQAEGHVNEISQKLNIPVVPICLDETTVPDSVETLLTTGFHIKEVNKLGKQIRKEVYNIPIEVDPSIFSKLSSSGKIIVVELETKMSSGISSDLRKLNSRYKLTEQLISNTQNDLEKLLNKNYSSVLLLSPRVWGQCNPEIKKHERVRLIKFKISDHGWGAVSNALNIPFSG
ncbi:MAG: winged helix-turn-helix domain-containing protein [Cyclobacteriaceae bacterium]